MQEACCTWPKCETELLDVLERVEQQIVFGQTSAALEIIRAAIAKATQ